MVLCSDDDHQLQSLFQHMKNESGNDETDLYTFGRVLCEMGELDDAEKYFRRYLQEQSNYYQNLSICYFALGRVTYSKGDYESSLNWYNKALEIFMQTLNSNNPNIAQIHNAIAADYYAKDDYTNALESYKKALLIFTEAYGEDHPNALAVRQKYIPADHPQLDTSYNNIGSIYKCLGQYDQALEYLNLSLEISKKSLHPQHPEIAITLENISLAYERKDEMSEALFYITQAATIFRHSLPPTYSRVIKIEQSIQHISSKQK
ncbi:unnamed protein product [Rotaria sordida]|uniref:Uncharacterized protein n=2 Tax=Rotaria sordida TaxID=392033 RepID=A0A815DGL6_9BILA|nr:unnamed protein product [Rotaria sordida]